MKLLPLKSALALAVTLSTAACTEDVTAERTRWDKASVEYGALLANAKKAREDLAAKAKATAVLQGNAAAQKAKEAVDAALAAEAEALAAAEKAVETARTQVGAALTQQKKEVARVAVDGAVLAAQPLLARAQEAQQASAARLAELESLLAEVRAAQAKALAEADALAKSALDLSKQKGGTLVLTGLVFTPEPPAVDTTAPTSIADLLKLRAVFMSCGVLRGELALSMNSGAKNAKALAQQRADAVKAWLLDQGIDPVRLSKVTATAKKDGADALTLTLSTACPN